MWKVAGGWSTDRWPIKSRQVAPHRTHCWMDQCLSTSVGRGGRGGRIGSHSRHLSGHREGWDVGGGDGGRRRKNEGGVLQVIVSVVVIHVESTVGVVGCLLEAPQPIATPVADTTSPFLFPESCSAVLEPYLWGKRCAGGRQKDGWVIHNL